MNADRELLARHARRDGRSIAILRLVDRGTEAVVEAEVFPHSLPRGAALQAGPYVFPDPVTAAAFLTEASEALLVLGCEIRDE